MDHERHQQCLLLITNAIKGFQFQGAADDGRLRESDAWTLARAIMEAVEGKGFLIGEHFPEEYIRAIRGAWGRLRYEFSPEDRAGTILEWFIVAKLIKP